MPQKTCAICSAGPEIVSLVEAAVKDGERLRDLERRCGYSKSTISKHMRRCAVRAKLGRTRKLSLTGRRVIVAWPDGTFTLNCQYDERGAPIESRRSSAPLALTESDLRASDLLIRIRYEALPPKPSAEVPQEILESPSE